MPEGWAFGKSELENGACIGHRDRMAGGLWGSGAVNPLGLLITKDLASIAAVR